MIIEKKELDDHIKIIKRLFQKDKKNANVHIQSNGEGTVSFYAKNAFMSYYGEAKDEGERIFSFETDPNVFGKIIKGSARKMNLIIGKKTIQEDGEKQTYAIRPIESIDVSRKRNLMADEKAEFKPFTEETLVKDVFKEAEQILRESDHDCTSYLMVSSKSAMAIEPKKISLYRLDEEFEFKKSLIHREAVRVLSKSLGKTLKHRTYNKQLVIKDGSGLFFISLATKVAFPDLKKINHKDKESKIRIRLDAKEMNDKLKGYTKKCTSLKVKQQENELVILPKEEDFEQEVILANVEGSLKEAMFETQTLKGLFQGYSGEVIVEHLPFANIYGETGYMWRITQPQKMSMVAGITEPDYDAIEERLK